MKKLAKNDEALALLTKLAAYVKPLCKQRKYRIESLNEFSPEQKGLLGMNVNRSRILIRLRHPDDITRLYHWEFVLGTLIHELTHMEISEHSAAFYKLMDALHDEVEKLQNDPTIGMTDNYSTLGGGKINEDRARVEAGKAAIKRFQNTKVMGGVNVLGSGAGGGTSKKPLTKEELRNLAADAVERRLNDNKWCPNEESMKRPVTSKDKGVVFIQCILCEVFNESTLTRCRVCDSALPKTNDNSTDKKSSLLKIIKPENKRKQYEVVDLVSNSPQKLTCLPCSSKTTTWSCTACTLDNDENDDHCAVCNLKK